MKSFITNTPYLVLIIFLLIIFDACHPARTTHQLQNTETIRYIETLRIDTITVQVPVPVEAVSQTIPDSASHIETSIATSNAWITDNGKLAHTLENKKTKITADIPIIAKTTTNTSQTTTNKLLNSSTHQPLNPSTPQPNTSTWHNFKSAAFWYIIAALIIALIYIFRKPLLRILCKLHL